MTKVLLTGATGFVGSNLLKEFQTNGFKIVALVREKAAHLTSLKAEQHPYESLAEDDTVSAEYYIHLAGKAHDLKNTSDEAEYFDVNVGLTQKVYDHFIHDLNAKTFIFVSSVKAAADAVSGELTEETKPNPVTAYGKSKLMAEQYLLENIPEGRTIVILRPCMIHGPGNKGNLNLLHSIISKGIPWPLGSYDNSRSFLSIENLCYVITNLIKGEVESGIYHVADDEPLSTTDLVEMIARINGKKANLWNIPKPLIKIIAKTGNVLPFPLNEERLNKLTENYLVSNEKIKKALGIERMPISAKEGMINTLKSFES